MNRCLLIAEDIKRSTKIIQSLNRYYKTIMICKPTISYRTMHNIEMSIEQLRRTANFKDNQRRHQHVQPESTRCSTSKVAVICKS